ncbi:hypothetical protein IKQ21_03795 [bacterium]|nr:hypothetical protein [bacterium]
MPSLTINLLQNKVYPTGNICATKFENAGSKTFTLNKNCKTLVARTVAIATDLAPVVGITLWTPEKKIAVCSTPTVEKLRNVPDRVKNLIETLHNESRKSYDRMLAFITGGVAYNSHNANAKDSAELVEKIYDAFQKEGIETSVIADQFADSKTQRINSYCVANNITLWGKPINQLELNKNSNADEIENALAEEFDFVELSPNIDFRVIDELPTAAKEAVKRAK